MWSGFESLEEFIFFLERHRKLVRIQQAVSTELEITEICSRLVKTHGPAVLFERVYHMGKLSKIPVLANLFSTVERIGYGLGLTAKDEAEMRENLRTLGQDLSQLKHPRMPESLRQLRLLKRVFAARPRLLNQPSEHSTFYGDAIDLDLLPIQRCWPGEPAPLITWGMVVTTKPGDNLQVYSNYNVGVYRLQVLGKNKLIVRWLKHRGGASHHFEWMSKKMPMAVVIGSDPASMLSAAIPTPEYISEYQFSGILRQSRLKLRRCASVELAVPANAHIVLEGYVDLNEQAEEGPYGDHTGFYNSIEKFPVLTLTAITMKANPIYVSTYTGKPPDEPSAIGEALNEIFIPLIQQQFPEICDFWLPPECCSYRTAVVSIRKQYPGHARRIMMGIWSYLKQFSYTKWIIITDHTINIRNWSEVMWTIVTHCDFKRDIMSVENTPMDYLDFASIAADLGTKLGFDATTKIPPETNREWGQKIKMSDEIIAMVNEKWSSYGISAF